MDKTYLEIFNKHGFHFGRCFGSKSFYHETRPAELIVFNARVYLKSVYETKQEEVKDWFKGKDIEIWYGDLNLNEDIYKLYIVYLDIGEPIVITYESGRKVLEIGDKGCII